MFMCMSIFISMPISSTPMPMLGVHVQAACPYSGGMLYEHTAWTLTHEEGHRHMNMDTDTGMDRDMDMDTETDMDNGQTWTWAWS